MKQSKETKERNSKTKRLQYEQSGGMPLEQREKIREGQKQRWIEIKEMIIIANAVKRASELVDRLLD